MKDIAEFKAKLAELVNSAQAETKSENATFSMVDVGDAVHDLWEETEWDVEESDEEDAA